MSTFSKSTFDQIYNARLFPLNWLNSVHLDTLLPNSSWKLIQDEICEDLASRCTTQIDREDRKQALFLYLGPTFVKKYFPDETVDPSKLKPPYIKESDRTETLKYAQSWLDLSVRRCLEEKKIYFKNEYTNKMESSEHLQRYQNDVKQIFSAYLGAEMAKQQIQYLKRMNDFKEKQSDSKNSNYSQQESLILNGDPEIMTAIESTQFSSFQTEFLGNAAGCLVGSDPEMMRNLSNQMSGRRLPTSLRRFIWRRVLCDTFNSDAGASSFNYSTNQLSISFDQIDRERFGKGVARGVSQLGIQRATETPINPVIVQAVIETFEKAAGLRQLAADGSAKFKIGLSPFETESVHALNVLYAYNRTFDSYLVAWLVPLQLGLGRQEEDRGNSVAKATFIYELAMYLNLLSKKIFPDWPAVSKMADKTMSMLEDVDPDYVNHLSQIAVINVPSQNQDFLLPHLMRELELARGNKSTSKNNQMNRMEQDNELGGADGALEENESNTANQQYPNEQSPSQSTRDNPLQNSIIYIRKWISEAFVTVIRLQASLFLFDQLFMENFNASCFEDMALALLLLLKPILEKISNHKGLRMVMLEKPVELLTADVIRAWVWLHRGGEPNQVPQMNRLAQFQISDEIQSEAPIEEMPASPRFLPPIGICDLVMTLIMSKNILEKGQFIGQFEPNKFRLEFQFYYGSTLLQSRLTQSSPVITGEKLEKQFETYVLRYPNEETVRFLNLDVTHLDLEREMNCHCWIIGKVLYQLSDANSRNEDDFYVHTFGWARIDPYMTNQSPENEYSREIKFEVNQQLNLNWPIFAGSVADNFRDNFKPPEYDDPKELLLIGSHLGGQLFDASSDPVKPEPKKEPVKLPTPPPVVRTPTPEPVIEEPAKEEEEDLPPTQPDYNAWVPFSPANGNNINKSYRQPPVTNDQPFCLYIDQIRFLPDNSTICKVTGRIIRTDHVEKLTDILVFPDYATLPRSPEFSPTSRIVINMPAGKSDKGLTFNAQTLILLRVYTVTKKDRKLVVVGNCLVRPFDDNGILRVGGYQKRLHNALPKNLDINTLTEQSLDTLSYIICSSLTFRLLPFTKNPIKAPEYSLGYYQSSYCQPTDFEWEVFGLYERDEYFPKTLREVVLDLRSKDINRKVFNVTITNQFIRNFVPDRMDNNKYLIPGRPADHLYSTLSYRYRPEKGIYYKADRVYGLEENKFLFVVGKIVRGKDTINQRPIAERQYGVDKWFVSAYPDLQRPMNSTKWLDELDIARPYYDERALMIVQVFGLDVKFRNGQFFKRAQNSDDTPIGSEYTEPVNNLSLTDLVGWSAIPLFDNNFVAVGKHVMPLYQKPLTEALLKRFQKEPISSILQQDEFKDVDKDSIVIYILDGHEKYEQAPEDMPIKYDMIASVPEKKKAAESAIANAEIGRTYAEFLLELPEQSETTEPGEGEPDTSAQFGGDFNEFLTDNFRTQAEGTYREPVALDKELIDDFYQSFDELVRKLISRVPRKRPYLPLFI